MKKSVPTEIDNNRILLHLNVKIQLNISVKLKKNSLI